MIGMGVGQEDGVIRRCRHRAIVGANRARCRSERPSAFDEQQWRRQIARLGWAAPPQPGLMLDSQEGRAPPKNGRVLMRRSVLGAGAPLAEQPEEIVGGRGGEFVEPALAAATHAAVAAT